MRVSTLCLVFVAGCPPASSKPTPAQIAGSLVEAGCVAASPTLAASVQAELEAGSVPAWAACLAAGGTVAACAVPCDAATSVTVTRP